MPWPPQSRRATELPAHWAKTRQHVLQRDHHACQLRGTGCTGTATDVDHIGDRHNHSLGNLRAACGHCHAQRTATQGHQAMRTIRARARHPREQHPGRIT